MLVAIHQPNFLPWLGYFDKLARADVFVLLDNVQFPKKGGTWMNRVRILAPQGPAWLTIPVVRAYTGTRSVAEMEIDNSKPWREKLLKTIRSNYSRAPHLEEAHALAAAVVEHPATRIGEYNHAGIKTVADALGLDTRGLTPGTSLPASGAATDLLIATVRSVGGSRYLCGGGAGGYQEDDKFASAGVELVYQNFKHPHYNQGTRQEFVPGLSVLDALMWCGISGTRKLLRDTAHTHARVAYADFGAPLSKAAE